MDISHFECSYAFFGVGHCHTPQVKSDRLPYQKCDKGGLNPGITVGFIDIDVVKSKAKAKDACKAAQNNY